MANILILTYENDIRLWDSSIDQLKKNHIVRYFACDPTIVSTNLSLRNSYRVKNGEIYDLNDIFIKNISVGAPLNNLRRLEAEKLTQKSIYEILLTDPVLLSTHHPRKPYYKKVSLQMALQIADVIAGKCYNILTEFRPDIILSFQENYLAKNIMLEVGRSNNVPVRILEHLRFKNYYYFHLGFEYGPIKQDLSRNSELNQEVTEALNLSNLYEAQAMIKKKQGVKRFLISELKECVRGIGKNLKRLIYDKYNYQFWVSDPKKVVLFYLLRLCRLTSHLVYQRYDQVTLRENFFLYPLHTLPESSTLTQSTIYDELTLIEQISRKIPIGTRLYVKENANMITLRNSTFYSRLKALDNVRFISFEIDTKCLIKCSCGVITISGTMGLEAALHGKPVYLYGLPDYRFGICNVYSNIDEFFRKYEEFDPALNSISMANFLHDGMSQNLKIDYHKFKKSRGFEVPTQFSENLCNLVESFIDEKFNNR